MYDMLSANNFGMEVGHFNWDIYVKNAAFRASFG